MIELCLAAALLTAASFGGVRAVRHLRATVTAPHAVAPSLPNAPLGKRRDLSSLPDLRVGLETTGTFLGMSDELLLERVRTRADRALQAESRRLVAVVPRRVRGRLARGVEADADQHAERPAQGGRGVSPEPPARPARGAAGGAARGLARRASRAPPPREPGEAAAHQGRDRVRPRRPDHRHGVVLDPGHQGLRLRHARRPPPDPGVADAGAADPAGPDGDGGAGVEPDRVRLPDRRTPTAIRAAT